MKYYSKGEFLTLKIINISSLAITLFVFFFGLSWFGSWSKLMYTSEGFIFNLFYYVIPSVFFILSPVIVWLQQKGHERAGYFMAVLALLFIFYFIYFEMTWKFFSNISNFIFSAPPFVLFLELILFFGGLVPFYVLGKIIKEDFFKKAKIAE